MQGVRGSNPLSSSHILGSAALIAALSLAFISKPVHVDDANFLRLAAGAASDPWRPHAISINWLGRTQRAFDVLSNPPGIAWWLAPVHDAPVWLQHLWMLPWLGMAMCGAYRLGRSFGVDGGSAMLVMGTAPVSVLAAQSLTPDLPLLACVLAGVSGFLLSERRAGIWALLAGCAALFRYSGICIIPLLIWAGFQRGRTAAAMASAIPASLLFLHDLHAYGQIHFLAMIGFQSATNDPLSIFRKATASVAMLGGACLLPVLAWQRLQALAWAALGAVLGWMAGEFSGHGPTQMAATVLFASAGAVAFDNLRFRTRDDVLLAIWSIGGVVFLLSLQFAATRYWVIFFPALAIASLRQPVSRRRILVAVGLNVLVAVGMSVDDAAMARAYQNAARRLADQEPGVFAGHWGWQHYMEKAGWTPLEAGSIPSGKVAVAHAPWPQPPAGSACLLPMDEFVLEDRWWGPRVHTAEGAANYHSYLISGSPVVETYAPWTFSNEPYDRITIYRPCR